MGSTALANGESRGRSRHWQTFGSRERRSEAKDQGLPI